MFLKKVSIQSGHHDEVKFGASLFRFSFLEISQEGFSV